MTGVDPTLSATAGGPVTHTSVLADCARGNYTEIAGAAVEQWFAVLHSGQLTSVGIWMRAGPDRRAFAVTVMDRHGHVLGQSAEEYPVNASAGETHEFQIAAGGVTVEAHGRYGLRVAAIGPAAGGAVLCMTAAGRFAATATVRVHRPAFVTGANSRCSPAPRTGVTYGQSFTVATGGLVTKIKVPVRLVGSLSAVDRLSDCWSLVLYQLEDRPETGPGPGAATSTGTGTYRAFKSLQTSHRVNASASLLEFAFAKAVYTGSQYLWALRELYRPFCAAAHRLVRPCRTGCHGLYGQELALVRATHTTWTVAGCARVWHTISFVYAYRVWTPANLQVRSRLLVNGRPQGDVLFASHGLINISQPTPPTTVRLHAGVNTVAVQSLSPTLGSIQSLIFAAGSDGPSPCSRCDFRSSDAARSVYCDGLWSTDGTEALWQWSWDAPATGAGAGTGPNGGGYVYATATAPLSAGAKAYLVSRPGLYSGVAFAYRFWGRTAGPLAVEGRGIDGGHVWHEVWQASAGDPAAATAAWRDGSAIFPQALRQVRFVATAAAQAIAVADVLLQSSRDAEIRSPTATLSPTAAPSPTLTSTPTATSCPSPSASCTGTASATDSRTASPPPSRTPTPTLPPTRSSTRSPSASRSDASTLSPSPTHSLPPSPSQSPTPVHTATPDSTLIQPPAVTQRGSPSPSTSPIQTPHSSPGLIPTATRTPDSTRSVSQSPALTVPLPGSRPTASITPTPTPPPGPTATWSASWSPTRHPTPIPSSAGTPTSSPSRTLTQTRSSPTTATLTPTASVAAQDPGAHAAPASAVPCDFAAQGFCGGLWRSSGGDLQWTFGGRATPTSLSHGASDGGFYIHAPSKTSHLPGQTAHLVSRLGLYTGVGFAFYLTGPDAGFLIVEGLSARDSAWHTLWRRDARAHYSGTFRWNDGIVVFTELMQRVRLVSTTGMSRNQTILVAAVILSTATGARICRFAETQFCGGLWRSDPAVCSADPSEGVGDFRWVPTVGGAAARGGPRDAGPVGIAGISLKWYSQVAYLQSKSGTYSGVRFAYALSAAAAGALVVEVLRTHVAGSVWEEMWRSSGAALGWRSAHVDFGARVLLVRLAAVADADSGASAEVANVTLEGPSTGLASACRGGDAVVEFCRGVWHTAGGDFLWDTPDTTASVDPVPGPSYAYVDSAAAPFPGSTAFLTSGAGAYSSVRFMYQMFGMPNGSLTVEGLKGPVWDTLWTARGRDHGSSQAPWSDVALTFPSPVQRVRFRAVTGIDPGGYAAVSRVTLRAQGSARPSTCSFQSAALLLCGGVWASTACNWEPTGGLMWAVAGNGTLPSGRWVPPVATGNSTARGLGRSHVYAIAEGPTDAGALTSIEGTYSGMQFAYRWATGNATWAVEGESSSGAWQTLWAAGQVRDPATVEAWVTVAVQFPVVVQRVRFRLAAGAAGLQGLRIADVVLNATTLGPGHVPADAATARPDPLPGGCRTVYLPVGPLPGNGTKTVAEPRHLLWWPAVCGRGCWFTPGGAGAAAAAVFVVENRDGAVAVTRRDCHRCAWAMDLHVPLVVCGGPAVCDFASVDRALGPGAATFCCGLWMAAGDVPWGIVAVNDSDPSSGPSPGSPFFLVADTLGNGTSGTSTSAALISRAGDWIGVAFEYRITGPGASALAVDAFSSTSGWREAWRAYPGNATSPWRAARVFLRDPAPQVRLRYVARPSAAPATVAVAQAVLHGPEDAYVDGQAYSLTRGGDLLVAPSGYSVDLQSAVELYTCHAPVDLSVTNPWVTFSTCTGRRGFVPQCGGTGREAVVYIRVPPLHIVSIGQIRNNFDSVHEMRHGGACPGAHVVECIDDPDLEPIAWPNLSGDEQVVYFIVDAVADTCGDFQLQWKVEKVLRSDPQPCPGLCGKGKGGSE